MHQDLLTKAGPIIRIAERIKKVMLDKQEKILLQKIRQTNNTSATAFVNLDQSSGKGSSASLGLNAQQQMLLLQQSERNKKNKFPVILEKEVEAYNSRKKVEKKRLFEQNSEIAVGIHHHHLITTEDMDHKD